MNKTRSAKPDQSLFPPISRNGNDSPNLHKSKQLTVITESTQKTSPRNSLREQKVKKQINLSLPSLKQNEVKSNDKLLLAIKKPSGSGDYKKSEPISIYETVKRRLTALKLLQFNSAKLEVNFYQDLYLLECKYNKLNRKVYETRKKIIIGNHEPTEQESDLDFLAHCSDALLTENEISRDLAVLKLTENKTELIKGIPDFWLNVLEKVSLVNQMIEESDKPILKHLINIDIDLSEQRPFNFKLKFYFEPNEYFSETVLTKTFLFKIEMDQNNPFMFEAPESERSIGCSITWKEDKNVTENNKESFFNFFDTNESVSSEYETEIAIDYEIGYIFKEKIIPRAILYYLGEINDDNSENYIDLDSTNQSDEDKN